MKKTKHKKCGEKAAIFKKRKKAFLSS